MLQELQAVDLKIDGRESERQALVAELEALDRRVTEARDALAVKTADFTAIDEEKRTVEANLALETDNIQRSEARLSEIKTQKEYQAVLKEISSAKKVKGELEEEVLQKAVRLDELKLEISGMESDLGALEGNVVSQKSDVQGKLKQMEGLISVELAQREAAEKGLPASLLNRYNALRQKRQGVAVVEARDGGCLGCNMNIPPQLYNNLHKGDEIIFCPHCQRVLYIRQDKEAAA